MNRLWGGVAAALAIGACAPQAVPPPAPVQAGPAISIAAEPVPLDSSEPGRRRIGGFVYAGGLALTSEQTSRLHGLSDLAVTPDGGLLAISDDGDLLSARIVLDHRGRAAGLAEAELTPLKGPDGQPLQGKADGDAEGLAVMSGGDILISFERNHRIWLYPAAGGPPRPVPYPDAGFPSNGGMEALAPDPSAGADAYVIGAEESGETWSCRLESGCAKRAAAPKEPEFGLVAVRRLPEGRTAWLLRAWDPLRGSRIELRVTGPDGATIDRLILARPMTVDNFEGVAAIPRPNGLRFYLLSDDNFTSAQRTLLMAFDWTPPG